MFEYKIYGMDCLDEVSVVKRELLPYVKDESLLQFNLLKGKLMIHNQTQQFTQAEIEKRLKATGYQFISWQQYEIKQQTNSESFWQKHMRSLLTLICALFLIIGFAIHGSYHGFLDALIGEHGAATAQPVSSIVFYVLALIVGGFFIYPKAWAALKRIRPDINLLMTIAVIGAICLGQWLEAGMIVFLFSIASLLESWSVGKARKAIQSLLEIAPDTANVYCSHHKDIDVKKVEEVNIGATIVIKPGERVPLDGVVKEGESFINQAPITGESLPVEKKQGDPVFAGSLNEDGLLYVKVTKLATESTLSNIIRQVELAQANKAKSEMWVEQFAKYYTPLMMIFALLVAIVPPLLFDGSWYNWIYEALVILVIACPCALVISTPVSIVSGLSAAANHGILIKGGSFLELPAKLKAIAFDKTGTITQGKPLIQSIINISKEYSDNELLQLAAALEEGNNHPLAHAIFDKMVALKLEKTFSASNIQVIKGKAITGQINDHHYWIGSHKYLHEKTKITENLNAFHDQILELEKTGHSLLIFANSNHILGLFAVADSIKDNAKDTLTKLNALGIKTALLTGDNKGAAQFIAQQAGLDEVYSELLPEDKVAKIKALQTQYQTVAMVGDGINDAPALATADLSLAMGDAGSDVAIETADIALMSDDLAKLPWLIKHAKRVKTIIQQNITFALGLKVVFMALALLELANIWMAIGADMGASLLVVFNSLRLLKSKNQD
ncbi:cation-translocating P-type ATPase [Cysteiniphilum sp. QT6929]|uniref:heavy metal translocating P-type ATPase n=1 Tax=Cysteiniphilum sp. QT6929 TaxID=2975055 RepID=UPI0024B3B58C|nr:cation-translocating P-type ATPase [Cysteiniphilum sp. QT6929]WHN65943.1 cation-translocating P-type ATPase [Cysteiniphilum sp. QT6929]